MTIYAAIWEDRHTDTTVHLFSTPEKAIEFADKIAEAYRHGWVAEQEFDDAMREEGWLHFVEYGEGCRIHVVACEVDEE